MADTFQRGVVPGQHPAMPGQHHAEGGAEQGGVMGTIREVASDVSSRAGEMWDTTRQTVKDVACEVARTTGDAIDTTTNFMSRYPLATFCAGLGLGFLIALATSTAVMSQSDRRSQY